MFLSVSECFEALLPVTARLGCPPTQRPLLDKETPPNLIASSSFQNPSLSRMCEKKKPTSPRQKILFGYSLMGGQMTHCFSLPTGCLDQKSGRRPGCLFPFQWQQEWREQSQTLLNFRNAQGMLEIKLFENSRMPVYFNIALAKAPTGVNWALHHNCCCSA